MCLFKTKKNGNDMPLQHTKERKKTLKLLFPAHALRPTVDDVLRSHRDESTIGLSHGPRSFDYNPAIRFTSSSVGGQRGPQSAHLTAKQDRGIATTGRYCVHEAANPHTFFNSSKPGAQSRFAANNLQHQRLPVRAAP